MTKDNLIFPSALGSALSVWTPLLHSLSSKGGRLIAADPAYILAGSKGRAISPLKYSKLTGWGSVVGCILGVWREHHKAPNLGVDKGIKFQKEIRVKPPNNKEWLIAKKASAVLGQRN